MITAAIVLFNNDEKILTKAVNSFLATPIRKRLYLIDNSETDHLRKFYLSEEIIYIHTKNNLGFGKAHNLIMKELELNSNYHLILNPDTYFSADVLPLLLGKLNDDKSIGIIAPKILYANGDYQKSIRRFPRPQDFLLRRIPIIGFFFEGVFKKANYLDKDIEQPMYVDTVSGCFQLFRTTVFTAVQGFDPRYFMYMEDLDICRKVHVLGFKIFYFPETIVYHHSEYGSKKNIKLFWVHIKSIIKYFVKWTT